MPDLFTAASLAEERRDEALAPGAVLLRGFALPFAENVLAAFGDITAQAPFRHMTTPWGAAMSVAMTNCGRAGWLTDRSGYRYDGVDPETGQPWPAMPECFRELASRAADRAGYPGFVPDACLINRYAPGHQADAASGPGRARLGTPDCLGVAGSAGHLPVRWAEAS
jgi:alkylated DNA repair protein (DNA oxidative demethylase)